MLRVYLFVYCLGLLAILVAPSPTTYDFIVAKDHSSNFTTITEALAAAPINSNRRIYIKINSGIYEENIVVERNKKNITFIGDGMNNTVIRASKSHGKGDGPLYTATLAIHGDDFVAIGLTVENAANDNTQAVALVGDAEHVAYYKCRFLGYQDTVYARSNIQFFRECEVYGNIDFIFGNARVVFQNCKILVRTPLIKNQTRLVVTAQGREVVTGKEGTVFQSCTFQAATSDFPSSSTVYLGRPWRDFARVVVIGSFLDKIINPKGWLDWEGAPRRNETATYLEYNNSGPGADSSQRVTWPGYKTIDKVEANLYTVRNFIEGEKWIPRIGIPVMLDLV